MRVAALSLVLAAALAAREVRVQLYWKTAPGNSERHRVISIPLEEYVAGVLMGEASVLSSEEALKAMAVAVRTFAVHALGRHASEGFDFCDTTHCQDLRRDVQVKASVRGAVEATDSELLWYEGRVAATYYSRHCGGTSASAKEIWPGLYAPYLRSAPDTFCLTRGRGEWSAELPFALRITRRTASGRVAEVLAHGHRQSAEQFASATGNALGWNLLRSNQYGVSAESFAAESFAKVTVTGIGRGHGVGLCQIGAEERGKAGHNYESILSAYYPGTTLAVAAGGVRWHSGTGERVVVYASDAATLRELIPLADAALARAEQTIGLRAGARPTVRSYPTVFIYRDSTGAPGNVAGTASGPNIRLQPAGVLRSQGVLASTIYHEMLHVVVETNAPSGLPAWFREELPQHLSGGRSARIDALERRFGRTAVLGWVRSGLPAGLK